MKRMKLLKLGPPLVQWGIIFSQCIAISASASPACPEDALESLEAAAGGGQHTMGCDGVVTLRRTLEITNDVTLNGTGHSFTIDGGKQYRLFRVHPGVTLTLIHLTLANGFSSEGGAIFNEGRVVITGCTIVSNTAAGLNGLAGANGTNGVPNGVPSSPGLPGGNGQDGIGGAIYNGGQLEITSCQLIGNVAQGGAGGDGGTGGNAAFTSPGPFQCGELSPASVGGDGGAAGSGRGGGIYNAGVVRVENSTFRNNMAVGGKGGRGGVGGQICWVGARNTVSSGTSARGGLGSGGAFHDEGNWINLSAVTLSGNAAIGGSGGEGMPRAGVLNNTVNPGEGADGGDGVGGGIVTFSSNYWVNCTLAGNRAEGGRSGFGGIFNGGGCANFAGNGGNATGGGIVSAYHLSAHYCTIWDNATIPGRSTNFVADGGLCSGGGSYRLRTNGLATAATLVASNHVGLASSIVGNLGSTSNCVGSIQDLGYNLGSDHSAGFAAPTSLNGVDPKLGPLGNYGGVTETLPLLDASPAIDAGSDTECSCTDQRGQVRPTLLRCDIGAYEYPGARYRFAFIGISNGTTVVIRGSGPANASFTLETTIDWEHWESATSATVSPAGTFEIEAPMDGRQRFYRVAAP